MERQGHSTAPKTPPPPAARAFGVEIAAGKATAVSVTPPAANRTKKSLILFGCLMVATAGVWWWQHRPSGDDDPDVADHPEIAQVQKLKTAKDAAALAPMIGNRDSVVASRAVLALGDLGDTRAIAGAITDSRPDVRFAAASAIGSSAGPEHIPMLSRAMREDTNRDVRLAAMRSLSAVGDFAIFDHLVAALNDSDPNIRRSALAAIEKRIGLVFPDFKPEGTGESRAKAIAHIRQLLPAYKKGFEADVARRSNAKGTPR